MAVPSRCRASGSRETARACQHLATAALQGPRRPGRSGRSPGSPQRPEYPASRSSQRSSQQ
eukprot:81478-Alexandrium_andersonii.AAC.1